MKMANEIEFHVAQGAPGDDNAGNRIIAGSRRENDNVLTDFKRHWDTSLCLFGNRSPRLYAEGGSKLFRPVLRKHGAPLNESLALRSCFWDQERTVAIDPYACSIRGGTHGFNRNFERRRQKGNTGNALVFHWLMLASAFAVRRLYRGAISRSVTCASAARL